MKHHLSRLGRKIFFHGAEVVNSTLVTSLADAAFFAALAALLASPALFGRSRTLLLWAVAIIFADEFAVDWPHYRSSPLNLLPGDWNWNGKLLELAVLVAFAGVLLGRKLFTREELGLTFRQRPGTGRAVLFGIIPFFILLDATVLYFAQHDVPSAETIAFQLTLPGITEELAYRGLLLALFDRMFPPTRTILGAKIGYGAVVTSLLFFAVHAISIDRSLHLAFNPLNGASALIGSFVGVWIRARSGSLIIPILAHNLSNTVVTVGTAFL